MRDGRPVKGAAILDYLRHITPTLTPRGDTQPRAESFLPPLNLSYPTCCRTWSTRSSTGSVVCRATSVTHDDPQVLMDAPLLATQPPPEPSKSTLLIQQAESVLQRPPPVIPDGKHFLRGLWGVERERQRLTGRLHCIRVLAPPLHRGRGSRVSATVTKLKREHWHRCQELRTLSDEAHLRQPRFIERRRAKAGPLKSLGADAVPEKAAERVPIAKSSHGPSVVLYMQ